MEARLRDIESPSLQKPKVLHLLETLETSIEAAKELRDRAEFNDPDLRRALETVERFLKKRRRVCYGGMAINAHLPKSKQFYDLTRVIPDYDFFTPNANDDIEELVNLLKREGFEEPQARIGIHEGTTKLYVNYTAVADITYMPPWKYGALIKDAIEVDGILFADADFLRTNMYLELSRPRGEVERWDKVYKRLLLLNAEVPPKVCSKRRDHMTRVPKRLYKDLLDYCVTHNLVFCGANLEGVYKAPTKESNVEIEDTPCPIIIYAYDPLLHCKQVQAIIRDYDASKYTKIQKWAAEGEEQAFMAGVRVGSSLYCLCIQQNYCNSYNTVDISDGRSLRIGSLDTCITLYSSLQSVKGLEGIVPCTPQCFANRLVTVSMNTRDKSQEGHFPAFPLLCSGHQPTKASLLKAKAARIKSMKRKLKSGSKGKTVKRRS